MSTWSRGTRNALLTAHISVSVALLGDVAGLAVVTSRAMAEDDPVAAHAMYEILSMFSMVFGIPLSLAAVVTGVALGLGTRWGVLRHGWVVAKLMLILAVMALGALVVGPAEGRLLDGASGSDRSRAEWTIVVGALTQGVALLTAVGLSVVKPRRRVQVRTASPMSRWRSLLDEATPNIDNMADVPAAAASNRAFIPDQSTGEQP